MKHMKLIIAVLLMLAVTSLAGAETARLGADRIAFNASKIVQKTAAYTVTTSDSQVDVTATSADIVITLPSIADATASGTKRYKIVKKDATAYVITVTPATGDTIGGESARKLLSDEAYMVIRSGPGKDWTIDYETPYIVEDHEAGTYTTGIGSGGLFSTVTVSTTLTASACGNVYAVATDTVIMNLPSTVANCRITFVNTGAAGNNLLTINPTSADQIFGTVTLAASVVAIVGAAGDAVSNTKATTIRGDSMTLIGDGVDGWYIESSTGIWADVN